MKKPFRNILFVIGFSFIVACRQPYYIQGHTSKFYTIQNSARDSNLIRMLVPYKMGVDTQMQVVIGYTDIPLTKAQPECTLGNLMVDALMEAAIKMDNHVQAAVINYGTIRLPYLAPGPVTNGKIYELMPFDDMLTIAEVPGATLKQFCDHMARNKGWPVQGIRYVIKDKKATDITIDGKPLNEHLVYKLAFGSYIAKGGDYCDFLVPLKKTYTSIFIRDAIIDYVLKVQNQKKILHPVLEKRVSYAE